MPAPITNGAALTKQLRDSGTGEGKLALCRATLSRVMEAENRVATSAEVIADLEANLAPDHLTLTKARAFAEVGEWKPVSTAANASLEDQLIEKEAKEAEEKAKAKPEEKGKK